MPPLGRCWQGHVVARRIFRFSACGRTDSSAVGSCCDQVIRATPRDLAVVAARLPMARDGGGREPMSAATIGARVSAQPAYDEDVIRLFMIATMFWGVVGFAV